MNRVTIIQPEVTSCDPLYGQLNFMIILWQYPFAAPVLINFLKPFQVLAGDSSSGPPGVSHICLRHKKYNQGSGRKRRNEQYGLGLTQEG